MKLFINRYMAAGVLILLLASCKKQLDKFPYNQIALGQSFQTVRDATTWNNGLYAQLRGRVYGSTMYNTDIATDMLNASVDFGNRGGFAHRWDLQAEDGTLSGPWAAYYNGINNALIMINGFQNITPNGPLETGHLNRYKADAYAIRAYYYHELVVRFSKPYEPATASSDLGVPILTKFDVNELPARATVKQVYDQILSDLAQAKAFFAQAQTAYATVPSAQQNQVPNIVGTQGSTHFTLDAVSALEARVKLHMQDWAGAKAAADAVISSGRYPLISSAAAFKAYWHTDTKQESIMQLAVSTSEPANNNGVYLSLNTSNNRFRPDWIPSQWVVDMYEATDIRKDAYFAALPIDYSTGTGTLTLVNKYPGNPALFTSNVTNYQHAPKFLRIAELYLISAEAGARGTADADGLAKLNALRTARGLTALTGLADAALFAEVKNERLRELAFEGFRFYDLKRWHEGFTRRNPQSLTFLATGPGYEAHSVPADHPEFVWGIPTNDITINKNLTQNPGW